MKAKQDGKSYTVSILVFFCILFMVLLVYVSGDAPPEVLKKVTGTVQIEKDTVAMKEVPCIFNGMNNGRIKNMQMGI